jgi:hypothetical protein
MSRTRMIPSVPFHCHQRVTLYIHAYVRCLMSCKKQSQSHSASRTIDNQRRHCARDAHKARPWGGGGRVKHGRWPEVSVDVSAAASGTPHQLVGRRLHASSRLPSRIGERCPDVWLVIFTSSSSSGKEGGGRREEAELMRGEQ